MSDYFNSFDDEEEVIVIDSNDRIAKRLEEYKNEIIQKKEAANQKKVDDFVASLEYDEEGKPIIPVDEEGYYIIPYDDDGYPLVTVDDEGNLILSPPDEISDEDLQDDNPSKEGDLEDIGEDEVNFLDGESNSSEELLDEARAQAESILEDAKSQADAIFEHAKEEGKKEGYNEGVANGLREYQEKQLELEEKSARMQDELNKAMDAMEGELVDIICNVVERTFGVMFEDNKDIIIHLVDKAMMNAAGSKTFIIRVGEKNHSFIVEHKENLLERLGSDVMLDIIKDPLMDDDACMIETDGGVFNCGIDVALNSLMRDLRLLNL